MITVRISADQQKVAVSSNLIARLMKDWSWSRIEFEEEADKRKERRKVSLDRMEEAKDKSEEACYRGRGCARVRKAKREREQA